MVTYKNWTLKGTWWECCIREGQCPLWFGRDLWEEAGLCTSFQTYRIEEGRIQNVDMKGIAIIHVLFGIGPKMADFVEGVEEGAAYISDNASDEQRRLLESFVTKHLHVKTWRKVLGVKFVKIDISEKKGTYHVTMPFGEQKMSLTVGADGKNPVRMENVASALSNIRVCNTDLWKYHDYGRNLEFHNTSGGIADFVFSGD